MCRFQYLVHTQRLSMYVICYSHSANQNLIRSSGPCRSSAVLSYFWYGLGTNIPVAKTSMPHLLRRILPRHAQDLPVCSWKGHQRRTRNILKFISVPLQYWLLVRLRADPLLICVETSFCLQCCNLLQCWWTSHQVTIANHVQPQPRPIRFECTTRSACGLQ
jgi:hypothetical protein